MSAAEKATVEETAAAEPIIIDLGKQKKKRIKRLRQGYGRLAEDVADAVEELKVSGVVEGAAQPVIVVVRQKKKKTAWGW